MEEFAARSLYPAVYNPYYIVAPPYERTSAGIKALHLLCHHLNLKGYASYLIITDGIVGQDFVREDLITPVLNSFVLRRHLSKQRNPIIIYPEIIQGNPLMADCVVRYVLNYPGLLGGDKIFSQNEICFAYSGVLAKDIGFPDNVLFIPVSDTNIFKPPKELSQRSGTCFFASKYLTVHKGELFDITRDSIEITRQPSNQTPEYIADLFRSSQIFYTYENTALALEATLCGCPAVFLPNPYLKDIIGADELGTDGFAWGNSEAEIKRAKQTVAGSFVNYQKTVELFYQQLDRFINKTQKFSRERGYNYHQYDRLEEVVSSNIRLLHDQNHSKEGKNQIYAGFFNELPWWIELRIAEFLCTLGLSKDGNYLWDRAVGRFQNEVSKRNNLQKDDEINYALKIIFLPWWCEYALGRALLLLGLTHDGSFLVARSKKRKK